MRSNEWPWEAAPTGSALHNTDPAVHLTLGHSRFQPAHYWVAVKELKLSDYIGETLLFTTYTHYGNLIQVP